MANDLIPFREDSERVTCTPSTAVIGKRLVSISGDANADGTYTIAPTGAGGKAFGVAAWDSPIGGKVTVIVVGSGFTVPITTGAAVVAGDSLVSDATGQVITAAGTAGSVQHASGIALTGAASGADAQVLLARHSVTV